MCQTSVDQIQNGAPTNDKSKSSQILVSIPSASLSDSECQAYDEWRQLKSDALTKVPDCKSCAFEPPDWFDRSLFDVGRQSGQKHFFAFFVCHLLGLVALVHYLPVLRTLLATGKSTNLRNLFWRYLNTARHVRLWYEGDVWNPEDAAHKSLASVRTMHLQASHKRNVPPNHNSPLKFSQYDMHLTQVIILY
jgi:hypothetical protein